MAYRKAVKPKDKIHRFKVGDQARVLCTDPERFLADPTKPADEGKIVHVAPMYVLFRTDEKTPGTTSYYPCFLFKRKGNRWVENKKDHYYLVPA